MKLSIIIVSWNVCKDVIECIDSIYNNPPVSPYEIILVDNASSDETAFQVRSNFPKVVVICNKQNFGFAAANNKGIQEAKGDYILLLNPDTLILPESLNKLVAFMQESTDVGLCGPKIFNPDMTIQQSVRNFPNFPGMFYRFTFLKYLGLFRQKAQNWKLDGFDYSKQQEVEQLMGAAIIAKTSIIKEYGGFDERFFMYYEEVDLCYRVKHNGMRIVYFPGSQIIHLGGQSAKQIPAKVKYMMLRSLVLFMKKHHPTLVGYSLIGIFKISVFIRQLTEMIFYTVLNIKV